MPYQKNGVPYKTSIVARVRAPKQSPSSCQASFVSHVRRRSCECRKPGGENGGSRRRPPPPAILNRITEVRARNISPISKQCWVALLRTWRRCCKRHLSWLFFPTLFTGHMIRPAGQVWRFSKNPWVKPRPGQGVFAISRVGSGGVTNLVGRVGLP